MSKIVEPPYAHSYVKPNVDGKSDCGPNGSAVSYTLLPL